MRARLKVSRAGVELIKSFEGLRQTATRLPDGRWTLGYGHTFSAREGARVTQEDADALLRFDLLPIVDAINNMVLTPLNQNQFDALVSFCFNIGVDNFAASTVLRRINEGRMEEAAQAMDAWRSAEFNGQTYVLAPLIRRRAAEKSLFLTPDEIDPALAMVMRPVEDPSLSSELSSGEAPPAATRQVIDLGTLMSETSAADPSRLSIDAAAALQRAQAEQDEAARREAQRQEAAAAARREQERMAEAQRETERAEAARIEAARLERERLEREAAARLEAERLERERAEREATARLEAERLERERMERERMEREAAAREQERLEQARQERERLERERAEQVRQAEAERVAAEREAQARQDAERRESERLAAEKAEAERQEAQRQDAERRENEERLAAERQETERQEAQAQAQAQAKATADEEAEKIRKAEAAAALMRLYSPYGGGSLGRPLAMPVATPPAQTNLTDSPVTSSTVTDTETIEIAATAEALSPPGPPLPEAMAETVPAAEPVPADAPAPQPSGFQSAASLPPPVITALNPYAGTYGRPQPRPQPGPVEVPRPVAVDLSTEASLDWRQQLQRPLPENYQAPPAETLSVQTSSTQTSQMQAPSAEAQPAMMRNTHFDEDFGDEEGWTLDGGRVAVENPGTAREQGGVWGMIVSTFWWVLISVVGMACLGFAAGAYYKSRDFAVIRNGVIGEYMAWSIAMAVVGMLCVSISVWLIMRRLGGLKD